MKLSQKTINKLDKACKKQFGMDFDSVYNHLNNREQRKLREKAEKKENKKRKGK